MALSLFLSEAFSASLYAEFDDLWIIGKGTERVFKALDAYLHAGLLQNTKRN